MYLRRLIIISVLISVGFSCAPYKMKAIRANRDDNFKLAIKYGIKHLKGHPDDQGTIKLLEQAARDYFDKVNKEISHYQKNEEWEKIAQVAAQTYTTFSELINVVGIQFPTKKEMDYLTNVKERSNVNKAEELYSEGMAYFKTGDFVEALEKFSQCQQFYRHYKDSDELIAQSKYKIAMVEYEQATQLINQQKYEDACSKLERVIDYVPDFSDALQKLSFCKTELAQQYFNQADNFSQQGKYKSAYSAITKTISYQPDYPGARQKWNELRDKLTVRLAVFPFEADRLPASFGTIVSQQITTKLTAEKSEFLSLLDRQNLDKIFKEQALSQTGVIDENTAIEVGKMSGVNAIMVGTVGLVSYTDSKPMRSVKTGEYEETYLDPRKVKRTRKVPFKYTLMNKERAVDININYRIISVETGEILSSQSDNMRLTDKAEWVICPDRYVKYLPSSEKAKIGSKREPESREGIVNNAISNLAQQTANVIVTKLVKGE